MPGHIRGRHTQKDSARNTAIVVFKSSNFCPSLGFTQSKCVFMPKFTAIRRTIPSYGDLTVFQNGGHPSSWICNKSSAVAEMGDRGQNRHGPKRGGRGAVPISRELGLRLVQCGLGRGLLPYQAASSSIQPFGHNRHGPKIGWGGCALFSGGSSVHIEHNVT